MSNVNWMVSFEMEYPRYLGGASPRAYDRAYERMTFDECRLLLPMSQAAKRHFLSRVPDRYIDRIEPKVRVFTGGVRVPNEALNAHEDYMRDGHSFFRIGFVGRSFYRKGGPALLRAARLLRNRGHDVRLMIVSDVQTTCTYVADVPEELGKEMSAELGAASWVTLHRSLPNEDVFRELSRCDVFAFPTLDESLGWVVLEALGLGLPVISTDVFALPELIRQGIEGSTIELPLDKDRRWTGIPRLNPLGHPSYMETISTLTDGILNAVEDMIANPTMHRQLGLAGRDRFLNKYDESVAARRLAALISRVI